MKDSNGHATLDEAVAPNTQTDEEAMAALRGLLLGAAEAQLATEFATKYGVNVIKVDRKPFQDAMIKELQAPNLPWTPEQYQKVQAIR